MDSLVVDMGFVIEKVVFFEKTAQKFIANSKAAMDGLIQSKEIKMDKIGSDALFMYVWWDQ